MASIAESTIKQYNRPIKRWWEYSKQLNIATFNPTPEEFLNFLALKFQRMNSYSSLNTTRSAISLITKNEIGNNSLVSRFCKGANNIKPITPRYDYIWDPAPVINQLKLMYPHETLSLEIISKKLALLLALGTGHTNFVSNQTFQHFFFKSTHNQNLRSN